ncbi:MAG: hypothetical protein JWL77_3614 [Chthonomonadaceae bacterium]|nr:hypothetical protein [Chthonomonadaceae bacterium]
MPGLYHRHFFLCLALLALESAASSARAADGDTLWDLLSRTDHTALEPSKQTSQPFDVGGGTRRSLGPVPGFTLALNQESENDQIFNRPKRKKSGMFGGLGDWWSRMEQKTNSKITASGHQTLSLRYDSVSGSQSSYQDSQYNGQGSNGIYNDTQLDVDATLFNALHYHTQISNSPYRNANDNRVKLDYNTKAVRVEWGDFNPTMAGNSLIDFNRSLHGIQVTNHWGTNLKTTMLYSQTTAQTRTIVISGNGSTGPYYVYGGQIVDGSAHVRVDNKDMVQGADKDYTLDLYTGQLNFTHGNVILPTSTIAVSFEALDYSNSKGTIYGARTEFIPNHAAVFGLTYLTQTSPTSSTTTQRTEPTHGFGAPNWYSTAAPIDLSKPIVVTIDGNLVPPAPKGSTGTGPAGTYLVDTTTLYTNRFYVNLAVPSTSIVQIQYYPYDPNPVPGNRSIMGLDGRFALGKLGNVTLESAFSGLSLTGQTYGGQALQMIANLTPFKNLHTRLTVKDVSPTFSSIQSPGFNQNEKSVTLDGDYQASKRLGFTFNWEKAKRPSYNSTGTTASLVSAGNDDYGQYSIGANYRLNSAATLALNRTNLATTYILGGSSSNTSDTVSFNYTKGQLNLQAALANNASNVVSTYAQLGLPPPTGSTNAFLNSDSSTQTKRISTQWQPLKWLTLGGSYSDNAIRSNSTGTNLNTDARDTAFDADFRLIRNLHVHYNYDLSDSGNANALATTTTTGLGGTGTLGGGGINNGLGGTGNYSGGLGTGISNTYGATSFGGRSQTNRVTVDYNPRPGMQVGFHVNQSSSLGDYQYNSNTNGVGASFNWDLSKRIHLNAVYEVQKLAYTNSAGGSNTNTSVLSLNGRPFGGKLEVELSYQSSNTQSAFNTTGTTGTTSTSTLTDTSSDLTALRLGLSYRISRKQSIFTEMTSSISSGSYANTESYLSFGMDYDLTQQLGFRFGWQFRNRAYGNVTGATTGTTSNLNYSANSLLAEFNLHF